MIASIYLTRYAILSRWINYRGLVSALQSRFGTRVCMIKITDPDLLEPCDAIMKFIT